MLAGCGRNVAMGGCRRAAPSFFGDDGWAIVVLRQLIRDCGHSRPDGSALEQGLARGAHGLLPLAGSSTWHRLLAPLEEDPRPAVAAAGRVPVLLPLALDKTYDYLLPEGVEASPGAFVLVPFGPQQRLGVVWNRPVGEAGKPIADKKLKAITARLTDVPPLPTLSMRFAEWVARYTLSPLGMVARRMMAAPPVFAPSKPRFGVARNPDAREPPRMTPARKRALEIAADGLVRAKLALATQAQCSTGVIDGLIAAGTLVEVAIPERRLP